MTRPETSLEGLSGEQFGPYRIVRRIGIGGMAETYEAIRSGPSGFEQRVCLKLVLPFFQQNKGFVELFHREAKLAAKLRHSNIVGVIDFGEVNGRSYMALELIDGCDLRTLLDARDRNRLSPELVAMIGLDIAAALDHAHNPGEGKSPDDSGSFRQGIVHRDISPSNVLISRLGEVMLTDFGVAKAITGTARRQSSVKGKIPYMSAEQLKGDVVDGRSDLFALGVVMFEALAGRRPYEGPNDPATILLALNGEHPSLETLAPNAPPKLREVIESLLLPDANDRPQSAREVIEELDELTPSHRVRRELGDMVASTPKPADTFDEWSSSVGQSSSPPSPSEEETGVGRKRRDSADPEAATAPMTDDPLGTEPPRKSRRPAIAVVIGLVLAVGGLASLGTALGLLWPYLGDDAPKAGTVPAAAIEAEPVAPTAPEVVEEPAAEPAAEPTKADTAPAVEATPAEPAAKPSQPKTTPAPTQPARITVIVVPWGDVWIDRKPAGASPLKNKQVKPGSHEISVGQGRPSKTRVVRLRPGQRKTVSFDLTD
jgi:serine/threonine protein kinase